MSKMRDLAPCEAEEERSSLVGLGLAVERLREEADMTRGAVADRGGLTGNTITHVENGLKEQPKWGTLRRLAKGLGVELEELIRLAIELAPGKGGERLRRREREAPSGDVEGLVARGMEKAAEAGCSPFPGWEPFLPHLVHPLKVAAVEALLWTGRPLSAVLIGKLFSGAGDGFRESNVRYHLNHLVEVGMLEVVSAIPSPGGGPNEKFFYFADRETMNGSLTFAAGARTPREDSAR